MENLCKWHHILLTVIIFIGGRQFWQGRKDPTGIAEDERSLGEEVIYQSI